MKETTENDNGRH